MSDPRYPLLYQVNTRVWLTELARPTGRRASWRISAPTGHIATTSRPTAALHAVPDERWTANVSFGSKDIRTLFITTSTGLYAIRMRV